MGEFTGLKMVSFYFIDWKQSCEDMRDEGMSAEVLAGSRISRNPGVKITGSYGREYEGQTYSALLGSCFHQHPCTPRCP